MGNQAARLPDFPADDVAGTCTRVMESFTPNFVNSYCWVLSSELRGEAPKSGKAEPGEDEAKGGAVSEEDLQAATRDLDPLLANVSLDLLFWGRPPVVSYSSGDGTAHIVEQLMPNCKLMPVKWALYAPPVQTKILQQGWMSKMGLVKESWRRRYFVVANQDDNFRVYYFEKEKQASDLKKAKGVILLCGYRIKSVADSAASSDKHMLALVPRDRRRVWYLRCDTHTDKLNWKATLKYCCVQARAPLDKDPLVAKAFGMAYARCRWRLGLFSWFAVDRCESEQLAVLMVQLSEKTCMKAAYEKLRGEEYTPRDTNSVGVALDGACGLVAAAGWGACMADISLHSSALKERAASLRAAIIEARAEAAATMAPLVRKHTEAALKEVLIPELRNGSIVVAKALYKAYKELLRLFRNKMMEVIDCGLRRRDLIGFREEIDSYWGVMYPALVKVRKLTRNTDEAAIEADMTRATLLAGLQGMPLPVLERTYEAGLKTTMHCAVVTFVRFAEYDHLLDRPIHDGAGGQHAAWRKEVREPALRTLENVMRKLVHDAQARMRLHLRATFLNAVLPAVRGVVLAEGKNILSKLGLTTAQLVQDTTTATFVDMEDVALRLMDELVACRVNTDLLSHISSFEAKLLVV